MPSEQEYDELLMSLVDATLGRPPEERERYLRSVCPMGDLYAEVWIRVEWEERMGSFLREPLVDRERAGRPFAPGTRLGDRFRIIREVGYGGMGVVYEAIDEKLDRRVAIKCARLGYQNRLPPEVRAAREVSHFNVCKVHDLHVAVTSFGEVDLLVMEFIDGETLFDRIRRAGPVAEKEAREIARQVCAGLAQAHRQGVIHGDLKCSNIILARSSDGGVRAVITDFGLAKFKLAEAGGNLMSERGGTLDYMAPELLLGGRLSVATDLYALGVLFHIMLTGSAPGRAAPSPERTPERTAEALPGRRLRESDSQAPTVTLGEAGRAIVETDWQRQVADLPSPWKKIVRRCLAPRPEGRFPDADQVRHALEARSAVLQWAVAALVVLVAALAWWQLRERPAGPPVRMAVLPFEIEGPPLASAAGIGEEVASRLTGLRGNFIVMAPSEARRNRVDTPEKARTVLGATYVLRTRLRNSGTRIVAFASIADSGSGRILREFNGTYSANDAALVAKALIATVTGAFGLRSGVPQERVSPSAYSYYVQGLALMRRDNRSADEAIPYFEKAIAIDPRSALPYAGLAEAQVQKFNKGEGREWLDRAGATAAQAKSLNADSVPVLLISGYLQQEHGWYEQAIGDYNRAALLSPNSSDAWRRLAVAYEKANRTEEAVATYRKAIAVQPDDYRPYLDFGNFYVYRSQFRAAEELYRKATVVAPNLPSGHMNLGLALMELGRFEEAEAALLHSLGLSRSPRILMNLGALYYAEERFEPALRYFQESLAEGPPSAVRYKDLGDAYRHLKREGEAGDAYRAGRALAEEEVTGNPRKGYARALLAFLSAQLTDARRAGFEAAQALAMEPENAMVMREAAITYEALGEREKALETLRRAPAHLLAELNRNPDVKLLRADPRFQDLLQKKSDP